MSFSTNNNISSRGIKLQDLIRALGEKVSPKQKERITAIFNKYNTNVNGSSGDVLDMDEQIALLNDLHKADANGDVSRKDLRKAGLTDGYKAYRDFVEAYNSVVTSDKNFQGSVEFLNGGTTNATFEGQDGQHVYHYNNSGIYQNADFTHKDGNLTCHFDNRQRPSVITDGNITKQLYYLETEDQPFCIRVKDGDANPVEYIRHENIEGADYYQKKGTNEYYKYSNYKFSNEIYDNKGRVTQETLVDGNTYSYEYNEQGTLSKITVAKPSTEELSDDNPVYTLVKNDDPENPIAKDGVLLYRQSNGGLVNKYYTFNPETREFAEATAEQVNKPQKPERLDKIPMTKGWKNQKVTLNDDQKVEFNKMLTAEDLLPKLIELRGFGTDFKYDEAKLLKDLRHNNPSIFDSEGRIYDNADWSKLDFPSKETIKENYKKTEEPATTGASQKSGTESTTEGSEPVGSGDEDIDG